jgi:hypothetical protein
MTKEGNNQQQPGTSVIPQHKEGEAEEALRPQHNFLTSSRIIIPPSIHNNRQHEDTRKKRSVSTRSLPYTLFLFYLMTGGCLSFQATVNNKSWIASQFVPTTTTTTTPFSAAPSLVQQRKFQEQSSTRSGKSRVQLSMALVPLAVEELDVLLARGTPSGPQYATYWGRTKREQYNRFVESSVVMLIGLFFSYFLSFVLGGFVATILGSLFAFWGILSPDLKARQRNWELLGGRQLVDPWKAYDGDEDKQGLYGSLFLGRVDDVCVVEDTSSTTEFDLADFDDYTMDTDELEKWAGTPYLLRVRLTDNENRELQVHARMSEEYLDIEVGMPVAAILLSKSQSFVSLAALTDVFVPDAKCWVGDYPYLDRPEMEALLGEDDELFDLMEDQADFEDDEIIFEEDDMDEDDDDEEDGEYYAKLRAGQEDPIPVPIRKRRK